MSFGEGRGGSSRTFEAELQDTAPNWRLKTKIQRSGMFTVNAAHKSDEVIFADRLTVLLSLQREKLIHELEEERRLRLESEKRLREVTEESELGRAQMVSLQQQFSR